MSHTCTNCKKELVPSLRWASGMHTCMTCGEKLAVQARRSWCIAPMHKSNYMLITDRDDLLGINNKGGLIK